MKITVEVKETLTIEVKETRMFSSCKKILFSIGDLFQYQDDKYYNDEYYILAQTGNSEFNLISLKDGNRWTNPLRLDNKIGCYKLSYEDIKPLFTDVENKFWLVRK